ncbi:hypothetical protein B0T13DRAFT_465718, partial [Neurospora crassa]
MGVNGLWTVLQPCARPTNLSTLNRKRLAIDASIWIYQFLKAVRDKEGNALRNSHVVGFFRRICKLLWYGIKPVFVFDGGAPALKRATIQARRRRREGRRDDATRTAGKLLAVQMHRMAEEEEERRRKRAEAREGKKSAAAAAAAEEEEQEVLPDMDKVVYADELGMSKQERQKSRRFHKQDAYHLPDLDGGIEAMGKPDDPRIMSVEELEEYARQFENGEDINLYDFSKIDFDGEFFKSLPPADRYNILNAARLRSRLRMGLSKEQLDVMFPNRMDFSRFQIERVKERNHLTQRLMYEMGMTGLDLTLAVNATRVAGDQNREYILVKNEGAEGGYALGVVSKEKDKGQMTNPIDVDELEFQFQGKGEEEEDSEEDVEFEDVPIEGLNRLPKLTRAAGYRPRGIANSRRQFYEPRQSEEAEDEDEDDEALFVDNGQDAVYGDENAVEADEEEDLNKAIAMSLRNQHGVGLSEEKEDEDMEFEEVTPPEWTQKAVEAPKPIVSTNGRMVAHIVNNRASAAVPRRRESTDSSDSEGDIRAAMVAARRKQAKVPAPRPVVENRPAPPNTPFKGPLPFEKLNWKQLLGGNRPKAQPQKENVSEPPKPVETGEMEPQSDDDAGGFEKEPKDAPLPLPPWLANNNEDIRDTVRKQREQDRQMAEEDENLAREEQARIRKQREDEIMMIESSDESDGDLEILDAPPSPKKPTQMPGASLPSLDDEVSQEPVETSRRSPSPNEEEGDDIVFEDVTLPSQTMTLSFGPPATLAEEDAQIEADLFKDVLPPPAQQERVEGLAAVPDDTTTDIVPDPDAPALSEFEDDFSDPEEQELLASLAQEAEEHARFATQLNHKTFQENQAAYEQELKALRTQQRKDRRDADEVTQIMITECQALLRFFGIPYITAPMEAEAQCAELVRLGLVDGIVTDDSDTFLFGGTRVYKNMFNGNKFVECYLSSDIERDLSLSRDQLIALAQLLGSDYTEGLSGVGPVTAVEILSEFPPEPTPISSLTAFKEWWTKIQSSPQPDPALLSTPFRRKFRKAQATKLFLPIGFPNPAVFDAYLHPEVDSTPEPFQWGVPDLEGLRQFLMQTIGWSQERTDEVLVPVIRDMNKREREGTQSNITR